MPSSRAATTAASSTISARAKFNSTAVSFINAMRWVETRPRVDSISGTCTVRMSARRNTSSMDSARSTSALRCQACSTLMPGSKPTTFRPSPSAALATCTPIAPRPITPRVRPGNSKPTNCFLPASTARAISASSPVSSWAKRAAGMRLREAMNRPASTSSLTALALAPGVLNTGMPRWVMASTGMLLVPAPARAIASTESGIGTSCSLAERTSSAWGSVTLPPTS